MATLETIRTRAGVLISVVIGIALLSFIINPDSLQRASMMFSSKYDAGEISGKSISYQDYQTRLDYFTNMHKIGSGGEASINDQVTDQLREQAWRDFIKEYVLNKQFDAIGLIVSDDELADLINGNNPSPMIVEMFTNRQTGEFDRSGLINLAQNLDQDPNIKAYWMSIEHQVRDNQLISKYANLLTKSTFFNTIDVNDAVKSASSSSEFSYIVKPYIIADSLLNITTADLKKYYNDHKSLYEKKRARDIQYVSFPIKPSADDYRLALEGLQKIEKDFIATPISELGVFVNRNSEKVFDDMYYKKGELPLALDTFAFREELGAFLPVYQDGEALYNMARISGIKNLPDSVRASHILLSPENLSKADSIVNAIKNGADFAVLANQYSLDQVANQKGGDLGWFSFRTMVRPFSDSCFFNPKGKIMRVRTQFGEHIVKITDRSAENKHVQVAVVQSAVMPSKITSQNLFNQANTIATDANNDNKRFNELVAEKGLNLQSANEIDLNDKRLANFSNARELIRWAYEANVGDVSNVYEIDNNYFVVGTLIASREDGLAPFEQVKSEVEVAVKKEKQGLKIADELKQAMQNASNIDALGTSLGLQVSNVSSPITFATAYIPGIIIPEPKLVGAVSFATENKLTGPIIGQNGVYAFVVTNRTQQEVDRDIEKNRLQATSMSRAYDFYTILINNAKIKDNRGKFY